MSERIIVDWDQIGAMSHIRNLSRITSRQADVYVEFFMNAKSEDEIAGMLGIAVSTVQTHIRRMHKSLRDWNKA